MQAPSVAWGSQQCLLTVLLSPAATNFVLQVDHVKQPGNWSAVESARVIYSAGFFITVSPDSIMAAAQHCAQHDKIYCMNLSAPFIMQVC